MHLLPQGYWPVIIPLPRNAVERKELITNLFSSRLAINILRELSDKGEVCQRDLINKFRQHSNRTVIKALKTLSSLGLINEYIKVEWSGLRKVRVKCYSLTEIGKWFSLLFRDPDTFSKNELRNITRSLVSEIIFKLISNREYIGVTSGDLLKILCMNVAKALVEESRECGSEALVLGSLAIDHYVKPRSATEPIEYYEYIGVFPGGSGGNVAAMLSSFGLKTSFYGKIATDTYGVWLLEDMVNRGVNVGFSELDSKSSTIETIVFLSSSGFSRILCMINKYSALSPDSVCEELIKCKAWRSVYIGEVFYEVALKVAEEVVGNEILVYRPLAYALESMCKDYLMLLKFKPILVLNREKKRILEEKGIKVPEDLHRMGADYVIVTMDSEGAMLYCKGGFKRRFEPPKVKPIDTAGAGDLFSATLIYYLNKGFSIEDAVRNATVAATLSTTTVGARNKFVEPEVIEERASDVKVYVP